MNKNNQYSFRVERENGGSVREFIKSLHYPASGTIPFRREFQLIQNEITDVTRTDQSVIESIKRLLISIEWKEVRECRIGVDEMTLLHFSAEFMRVKLTKYLLDHIQIDVNVVSKSLKTPLQSLTGSTLFESKFSPQSVMDKRKDHFKDTFDLLIAHQADFNHHDINGFTAAHYAAFANNYEAIVNLLDLKFLNLNARDNKNMTPLSLACKYGHDEIALILIEHTNPNQLYHDINNIDVSPLHLTCQNKSANLELVKRMFSNLSLNNTAHDNELLVSCYYDPSKLNKTYTHSILKSIFTKKDKKGETLLAILINNSHTNILEYLFENFHEEVREFSEQWSSHSLTHLAARHGSPEVLRLLVKHDLFNVELNSSEEMETPLHIAASHNKFNFIKEFLYNEKIYLKRKQQELEEVEKLRFKSSDAITQPISAALCLDSHKRTPLFNAIQNGHLKSVEALVFSSNDVDLTLTDLNGNTVYHVCAETNNFEAMRFLLTRKDIKYQQALYINNHNQDHVIHTACAHGNLEIIRLVLSKLNDDFLISTETYLSQLNSQGYTCFHIACINGYFNIIEYFLKDLKMRFFLRQVDVGGKNTCLHLAAAHNHLSLVALLLKYDGVDEAMKRAKNVDENTALEVSFQRGYFDIIKLLVNANTNATIQEDTRKEFPLHAAAHEGNAEVMQLLLDKGMPISTLNHEGKNCLDIAIEMEKREVIKVLLKNVNWHQLIGEEADHSPQLTSLFEKKLWEMILLILDNCKTGYKCFTFTKLDPCELGNNNMQRHPLMLVAQSGQEQLLKHPTVKKLLQLKWRFIPRLAFYSNLVFYLLFLFLFAMFSMRLSNHITQPYFTQTKLFRISSNTAKFNQSMPFNKLNYSAQSMDNVSVRIIGGEGVSSMLPIILLVVIALSLIKNLCQALLIDGFAYLSSTENFLEIFTYIMATCGILSSNFIFKLECSSVAILSSFIVFTFLIQKLRVIGLYVLAFRRTLINSAKFFPIFLLVFIGFNLSLRLQTKFAMSMRDASEGGIVLKTFIMVLAGPDANEMGLTEASIVKFVIYFMFIAVICVILVNLFVGIAVGEINTVLDEADVQQISMRIIFVLKVQQSLRPFVRSTGKFGRKYLSLQFESYTHTGEFRFVRFYIKLVEFFKSKFSSREPSISLVDPQQRLEEGIVELGRNSNSDLKAMRENLAQKLDEVEHRLANSQQRIENCLVEMNCKTTTNFETHKEDASNSIGLVEEKCIEIASCLVVSFLNLNEWLNKRFVALRNSFRDLIRESSQKLLYNQRNIEAKLDTLLLITKMNHELHSNEKTTGEKTIHGVAKSLDEVNCKLDKSMDKLISFQRFYDSQYQSDDKIEKILGEIKETLEQQKSILLNLDSYGGGSGLGSGGWLMERAVVSDHSQSKSKIESKRAVGWKSPRILKLIQDFSSISKEVADKSKAQKSSNDTAKATTNAAAAAMSSSSSSLSSLKNEQVFDEKTNQTKSENDEK